MLAKHVLVTGGAGFIGSHLAEALIAQGHDVRIVDDLSTGRRENVPLAAEFLEGDLADSAIASAATADVDVVFHQAAVGSVPRSIAAPTTTDRANVHGTVALLDAAVKSGVSRVITASSSSIYGGLAPRPVPEGAPIRPRSPYAVSKAAGEQYLRVFAEIHGLQAVALRYFNVYGPRQRHDSAYAAVIPRWIHAIRCGAPPSVDGDGLQTRDFTFIEDVVAANLAAAAAADELCDGRAFNISGGREHSLLELLEVMADALGTSVQPIHGPERPGDVRHSGADISAAAQHLGWKPQVDLHEGIGRTVSTRG